MKYCIAGVLAFLLLATSIRAQEGSGPSSDDTAYWVNYWAQPRVILHGIEEEEFYKNMQDILFPWNDTVAPSNPGALDSNAQWLKDHSGVNLYIAGYASSRGELLYNLVLSQKRADWVKRALVSRGVSENRIVMTVGWGQLYPVCPELEDACWSRNRLVRFDYFPNEKATVTRTSAP